MKTNSTKWCLGHKVKLFQQSGNYDLAHGESPPMVPGPPPHLHKKYHEIFLIVEGEMEFMVNGEIRRVGEGESVDIPQNTIHTFSNKSNKPCKWINIHSPKGFSEFFNTMGIPEDESDSQSRSVAPEKIQEVIASAASYDMELKI